MNLVVEREAGHPIILTIGDRSLSLSAATAKRLAQAVSVLTESYSADVSARFVFKGKSLGRDTT